MDNRSLGHQFLRTAWIFQATAATPIFIFLGISTFVNLFKTLDTLYVFTTHLCNALLAAGILFTVIVQRRVPEEASSKTLILRFEIAKSSLATALWAWLFLDAIFGPRDAYGWYYDRPKRVMIAAVCSLMLFTLFYPTVLYAARDKRRGAIRLTAESPTADLGDYVSLRGDQESERSVWRVSGRTMPRSFLRRLGL